MALHRESVERDGSAFLATEPRRVVELANAQFVGQADAELVRKANAQLMEQALAAVAAAWSAPIFGAHVMRRLTGCAMVGLRKVTRLSKCSTLRAVFGG